MDLPIYPQEHTRLGKKALCEVGVLIHPKVFSEAEVRAVCRSLRLSTLNLANHVFMNIILCTGALSCWNMLVSVK